MPRSLGSARYRQLLAVLREMRAESGMTQGALAKRLGRPQSYVSKYESGERRLDLVELEEIALAVGSTLSAVVNRFELTDGDRPGQRS